MGLRPALIRPPVLDGLFHTLYAVATGALVAVGARAASLSSTTARSRPALGGSLIAPSSVGSIITSANARRLLALLPIFLPALCLRGARTLRRLRIAATQRDQPHRHPAAAARRPVPFYRHADLVEDLLAEAHASTAQPLVAGPAALALRRCIEDASTAPHPLAPYLRPTARAPARAAALLVCRIEALRIAQRRRRQQLRWAAAAADEEEEEAAARGQARSLTKSSSDASSSSSSSSSSSADLDSAFGVCQRGDGGGGGGSSSIVCKICMDEAVDVLIAPCGHLAACLNCLGHMVRVRAPALHHSHRGGAADLPPTLRCPICVTPATDVLRTFAC